MNEVHTQQSNSANTNLLCKQPASEHSATSASCVTQHAAEKYTVRILLSRKNNCSDLRAIAPLGKECQREYLHQHWRKWPPALLTSCGRLATLDVLSLW